jgi:cell wall-associated NlpC family hydrolase
MAYTALQAGWDTPKNPLGARNWQKFGTPVPITKGRQGTLGRYPMLGDVLVFWRGKKNGFAGHVGIYVGEDDTHFHVLGGNQKDSVSIARIEKSRLLQARRCKWKVNQPENVRRVFLEANGVVTTDER